MACPFLREPVDVEAAILRRNLREERLLRPRLDILSFPDNFLHDRYSFSAQSIIYLEHLLRPHVNCQTHRGHALSLSFVFLSQLTHVQNDPPRASHPLCSLLQSLQRCGFPMIRVAD